MCAPCESLNNLQDEITVIMKLVIKKTVFANRANKPRCTVDCCSYQCPYNLYSYFLFFFTLCSFPTPLWFCSKNQLSRHVLLKTLSLIRSHRTLPVRTPLIVVPKTKFEFYKWQFNSAIETFPKYTVSLEVICE